MGASDGDHDAAGHGAGHAAGAASHAVAESPEQAADRERSAAVQRAIAQAVARPLGPLLVMGGAGTSLALLSRLATSAPPNAWLWLLPSILVTAWGLALARSAKGEAS